MLAAITCGRSKSDGLYAFNSDRHIITANLINIIIATIDKVFHIPVTDIDTYVKLGIIPPGHKEVGFKELSWSPKDFDEATMNKVRKYSSRKGL